MGSFRKKTVSPKLASFVQILEICGRWSRRGRETRAEHEIGFVRANCGPTPLSDIFQNWLRSARAGHEVRVLGSGKRRRALSVFRRCRVIPLATAVSSPSSSTSVPGAGSFGESGDDVNGGRSRRGRSTRLGSFGAGESDWMCPRDPLASLLMAMVLEHRRQKLG